MNNSPVNISVIVPCYKVERYLEECVHSILSSTFRDFEVILVDDGSLDRSGEIADGLATRDNRIRVIHQKNGGVSKARKTGYEVSQGEWISFVDSDDIITFNALEDMYKASLENDTDIIIGFPIGRELSNVPEDYSIEQYRIDSISGFRVPASLWGRLIRRSIITSFMFDIPKEVRVGEDMLFNIRCAFAIDKAPVILNKYVYDHRKNEDSVIHTVKKNPDYEQLFHELRLNSIPLIEQHKYINATIFDRLHPVQWWSYHNPLDTSWMDSIFISNLKKDIQRYSYPMSFKDRIMLYNKKKLIRRILIPSFRMNDVLKKF